MLYEMLTGQHPFRGASTFETLHAVLTTSPPDVSSLNPRVPPVLGRIVMRLLEKAPEARFQSALDVVWALAQVDMSAVALPVPSVIGQPKRSRRSPRVIWWSALASAAALVLVLGTAWLLQRESSSAGQSVGLTRFPWPLPPGIGLASLPVVSPDGRLIAFAGGSGTGRVLYVRDRGAVEASAIQGTEGAAHPFWSQDSTWLGFFANGRLMKIALKGGAPVDLAAALFPFGGAAGPLGTIVFAPDVVMSGLFRVSADGGAVEPATLLDPSLGDTSHCWPAFLPDGVHFLYFVRSARDERRGLNSVAATGPPSTPAHSCCDPIPTPSMWMCPGRRRMCCSTLSAAGSKRATSMRRI